MLTGACVCMAAPPRRAFHSEIGGFVDIPDLDMCIIYKTYYLPFQDLDFKEIICVSGDFESV